MSRVFINFTNGTVLDAINFNTPNYVYTLQYRHTSNTLTLPVGDMGCYQNSQTYNQACYASCKECRKVDI